MHSGTQQFPDSKVHGANMGPTWVLSAPDGPHVGPMNLAIGVVINAGKSDIWLNIYMYWWLRPRLQYLYCSLTLSHLYIDYVHNDIHGQSYKKIHINTSVSPDSSTKKNGKLKFSTCTDAMSNKKEEFENSKVNCLWQHEEKDIQVALRIRSLFQYT